MKNIGVKYWMLFFLYLLSTGNKWLRNPLFSQIVEKNSIQYSQGNFNLVIQKSDLKNLQGNIGLIDTIFKICHSTLYELETNLSYKLNEKINFIAFCELNKYENFKHSLTDFKNPENKIFTEIFISGELRLLKSQIKYSVVDQFLKEYLLGLSFKEKFDSEYSEKTPDWLIKGFQKFYAYGIQNRDFQNFKKLLEEGSFNNINYIKPEHQELFGSFIWYMLDKEKGNGLNTILWPLISYANSFEKTFKIQFSLNFNQWFNLRIKDISDFTPIFLKYNDFEIPIKMKNILGVDVLYTDNFEYGVLLAEYIDQFNLKLKNKGNPDERIFYKIGQSLHYPFNKPSFGVNNSADRPNIIICSYDMEKGWLLSLDSLKFEIGNLGIYQIIEIEKDTVYLLHEFSGKTEVLTFCNNSFIKANKVDFLATSSSSKILGLKKQGNSWFKLNVTHNLYSDSAVISLNLEQPDRPIQQLYIQHFNKLEISTKEIILESPTNVSVVLNSPIQQSTLHLELKNSQWLTRSTEAKGTHFGQYMNPKSSKYFEYYLGKNGICINGFDTNTVYHQIDTLVNVRFPFDSIGISKLNNGVDSLPKYDSGRLFLSSFPKPNIQFESNYSLKYQNIKYKTKSIDFRNWYYFRISKLYLSNKEIGPAYNSMVPNYNFYNSMFTLFYDAQISSSNNRHLIDLVFYSNLNRRRVGFQMNQSFYIGNYQSNVKIDYRIRQIGNRGNQLIRNKSLAIEQTILKRNNKFYTGITIKYLNDELIPLNTTFEHLLDKVSTQHYPSILFTAELTGEKRISSKINYSLNFGIEPGIIIQSNMQKWINYFQFSGNVKYQIGYFHLYSRLDAKYGISPTGILYSLGGTNGWIKSDQFNEDNWNGVNKSAFPLQKQGGFIRGALNGDRIGSSFICAQSEIHLHPLRLVKSYVIKSVFLKQLSIYGLFDFGTAFTGNSPRNLDNPYNKRQIINPNYTLILRSYQNPYVYSVGYGTQFKLIGYTVRLENAWAKVGDEVNRSFFMVSFGKNF